MEKICVVGLGYIGLPTASLLATKGFHVQGVDINKNVVDSLNNGEVLIYEPALDIMVKSAVNSGQLEASTSPAEADIFILAVPTPFDGNKKPNLEYVEAAAKSIAPYLKPNNLVVLESTSPVGTTEKIVEWVSRERSDLNLARRNSDFSQSEGIVSFAHCPERVLPGQILRELVENDRIVGGVDRASTVRAAEFYRSFVQGEVLQTDSRTAELAKLSENSFRDVNIAYANELSLICDDLDINVWELIQLANRHPRVNILQPGPGVGGHCIAVDPWFIVDSSPQNARLIKTAREVNDSKPGYVVEKVLSKADRFKRARVACLGLSFKANIDDLRESPAVEIVKELAVADAADVLVVEPHIQNLPSALSGLSNVQLCGLSEALEQADIVLLLVNHSCFLDMNFEKLAEKILIDTRGQLVS